MSAENDMNKPDDSTANEVDVPRLVLLYARWLDEKLVIMANGFAEIGKYWKHAVAFDAVVLAVIGWIKFM